MEFLHDENGQEVLLKDDRFQVMMEWEKPYMEACIDALQPTGDVLEVGFGCGYASSKIQSYKPKSHTIIEYHPVVAKKAREWAKGRPHVVIIENTWQKALSSLGVFDAIFFDDYPLESEKEMNRLQTGHDQAKGFLNEGRKRMEEIQKQISFLKDIKYTDQDIDFFFSELDAQGQIDETHFLRFFFDLEKNKNISRTQLENVVKRLRDEHRISARALEHFLKEWQAKEEHPEFPFRASKDRLFNFLEMCLKDHMRKGSKFSCYLDDPTSKYQDERFVDEIITNPNLDYTETTIPVSVPTNCTYYKWDHALVITIARMA